MEDWKSLFGGGTGSGFGGGGSGGEKPKSSATAASIIDSVIGGQKDTEQLQTLLPWIVGGLAVVVLAAAAVAIALIRR